MNFLLQGPHCEGGMWVLSPGQRFWFQSCGSYDARSAKCGTRERHWTVYSKCYLKPSYLRMPLHAASTLSALWLFTVDFFPIIKARHSHYDTVEKEESLTAPTPNKTLTCQYTPRTFLYLGFFRGWGGWYIDTQRYTYTYIYDSNYFNSFFTNIIASIYSCYSLVSVKRLTYLNIHLISIEQICHTLLNHFQFF